METNRKAEAPRYVPQFEERPYGARLKLEGSDKLIVLSPHTNTARGVPDNDLRNGLRGHEDTLEESITFLGFLDAGKSETTWESELPLRYVYKDEFGDEKQKLFRPGDKFLSVSVDGKRGYWHTLYNQSDKPIMLLVKTYKKPADIRRE